MASVRKVVSSRPSGQIESRGSSFESACRDKSNGIGLKAEECL